MFIPSMTDGLARTALCSVCKVLCDVHKAPIFIYLHYPQ